MTDHALVCRSRPGGALSRPRGRGGWLAVVAVVLVVGTACGGSRPRTFITLATGGTGGVYYPLGGALAQVWSTRIPGVVASAQSTVASVFNVQAVERGRADVALAMGDVVYFAFTKGTDAAPRPHTALRAMAVLYPNTVQIVARRDGPIRRIADLRGRRIGVGAPGSGTEVAARIIAEAHGLRLEDMRADFLSFSEVASQLQDRTLDGGFVSASYPVSAITDVNTSVGIRLIALEAEAVAGIQGKYPFLKPSLIPQAAYAGQEGDIQTIAVDNLLVCHADLAADLVYALTKTFFEALPDLARVHVAAKAVSIDRAFQTPIPLHDGAARYYRERGVLE